MCLDWPKEVGEREKGIPGPRTRETRGRIHDKLLALEWSLVKQPSGTFLSRGSIPWDPTTTRLSWTLERIACWPVGNDTNILINIPPRLGIVHLSDKTCIALRLSILWSVHLFNDWSRVIRSLLKIISRVIIKYKFKHIKNTIVFIYSKKESLNNFILSQKISLLCSWGTSPLPSGRVSILVKSTSVQRIHGIRIIHNITTGERSQHSFVRSSNIFYTLRGNLF